MNNKRFGVPCLKYLVTLTEYRQGDYVTPALASDLLAVSKNSPFAATRNHLDAAKIFSWIRGYTVPMWAQNAALMLAIQKGWQLIDEDDVWCAVWILSRSLPRPLTLKGIEAVLTQHQLNIPHTLEVTLENVIIAINCGNQ